MSKGKDNIMNLIIASRPESAPNTLASYVASLNILHKKLFNKTIEDLEWLNDMENFTKIVDTLNTYKTCTKRNYLNAVCVGAQAKPGGISEELYQEYNKLRDFFHMEYLKESGWQKNEYKTKNWATIEEVEAIINHYKKMYDYKKIPSLEKINKLEKSIIQNLIILKLMTFYIDKKIEFGTTIVVDTLPEELEYKTYYLKGSNQFIIRDFANFQKYGEQKVNIPQETREIIDIWLKHNKSGYLFIDIRNNPLRPVGICRYVTNVFKERLNRNITPSLLREIYLKDNN